MLLANRLSSKSSNKVALIEAGQPSDIWKVNMLFLNFYTIRSKI